MSLELTLGVIGLLGLGALGALLAGGRDRLALRLGCGTAILGCAAGLFAAGWALVGRHHDLVGTRFVTPLGPLRAGMDELSAFFLLCVFLVSGLGATYALGYLRDQIGRRRLAPAAACFNLLLASMALLTVARDAVTFLMAWELMSVASFFLVTWESDREEVRRAGLTYLIASHLGAVFLFVLFVVLAQTTGRFDFEGWAAAGALPAGTANLAFLLALVGFGAKAGLWPVHIWLPDAHPAAPSHVSAVMSGVMIKMGIYGLLRTLDFLGPPPAWWGGLLLALGALSGVLGVLHALAQHDFKRLLAYHSVENIGIIVMGIGLGLLGRSLGSPTVALLGLAGGLLHVLNHGLFKGLLFQGAGSVLHATGTRELDQLGGLQRRMPRTALAFLVGAVAISGLPPLNGFVSEWLIYLGAFRGASALSPAGTAAALVTMVALALIGGLAAACFVKAFGVVFLGEPRSEAASSAHEAPWPMVAAMWIGAALCLAVGLGALLAVQLVAPVAAALAQTDASPLMGVGPLKALVLVSAILCAMLLGLALLRRALLAGRETGTSSTWGCGYAQPSPRMQYTAASFAGPVLAPFRGLFHRVLHQQAPRGYFPTEMTRSEHLEDRAERALVPAVRGASRALARLRFLQGGRVQLYLAYVLATLVALLIWQATRGAP